MDQLMGIVYLFLHFIHVLIVKKHPWRRALCISDDGTFAMCVLCPTNDNANQYSQYSLIIISYTKHFLLIP